MKSRIPVEFLKRKQHAVLAAAAILVWTLPISSSRAQDDLVHAKRIATGFDFPLYACAPPGDTGRLFVAEEHGKIKIINLPSGTVNPTPYLDVLKKVHSESLLHANTTTGIDRSGFGLRA